MAAPLGNKNAVGHNGSNAGRKSYAQEIADVQLLHDMFFEEISLEAVKRKIASGRFTLKDRFVQKSMDGNEKVLIALFKRIFPDGVVANFQQNVTEHHYIITRE